ncbi:MAG: phosphoribosyltransferase [Pelotomaculum sp.]|uniref:Predicted phosphoribosyltransferases n=1 Tax=Pelotomaculum thermopropionicum (strain DSM 13744 / JCM 10971 / SI) TaxID=370438 RepID=A5CY39_PELTS|nr:phosphoribosyltransferase [Pelotomaculum sp.]BAF61091.1 predicted phosphoribosyltransferases [Pelotomaculum thermopropionicum SI]
MLFKDRSEAGKKLAEKLAGHVRKGAVVLAVPRGGVAVGAEIARKLDLALDLIIPRKIGLPGDPEMAAGAVAQDGTVILNRRLLDILRVKEDDLEKIISDEIEEIKRRMLLYGGGGQQNYEGRQLIVVDDGIATGYTVQAALRSVRNCRPGELILAVPVASREALNRLEGEADRVVCLHVPDVFYAVGQFYERFEQLEDDEVIGILKELKIKE